MTDAMSNDSEHTPPAIPSAAGDPVEDSENTGLGLRAGDPRPMHSSAPHSGPEEPPSESWVRPVIDRGFADSPLDPLAEASLASRHSYPRESDETFFRRRLSAARAGFPTLATLFCCSFSRP